MQGKLALTPTSVEIGVSGAFREVAPFVLLFIVIVVIIALASRLSAIPVTAG